MLGPPVNHLIGDGHLDRRSLANDQLIADHLIGAGHRVSMLLVRRYGALDTYSFNHARNSNTLVDSVPQVNGYWYMCVCARRLTRLNFSDIFLVVYNCTLSSCYRNADIHTYNARDDGLQDSGKP